MQAILKPTPRSWSVSSTGRLALWAAALWVLALALGLGSGLTGWSFGDPWIVLGLGVVAAVAERSHVTISKNINESISLLPTLFAALLFGPLAALAVSAMSMAGGFVPGPSPYLRWATYTGIRSVTGALTGFAALEAGRLASKEAAAVAIGTTTGAFTAQALDALLASCTLRLRRNGSVLDGLKTLAPLAFAAVPLYAPIVAGLAFAYYHVSPWILPLFFVPALAAQKLFGLYQDERRLAEDLSAVNERLERANLSFATALVATLDARDRYTAGHSAAVAIYARDIACRLALRKEEQQLAHLCGLVHDIGKIGLPAGLLEKPGALTLEERRQMEMHPEIGERILDKVEDYAEIARIVRHHHERWDGQGYPDGLEGEGIPLLSRIIAVADAYNAMTSDRPYRDAMPSRVARMRLAQGVESQFDTTAVAAFEAILAGATESYRMGRREDFSLAEQDYYSGDPFAEVA